MNGIMRIIKNGFWYSVVMLAGGAYYEWMPHDNLPLFAAGYLISATVLWLLIGQIRRIVKF